MTAKELADTSLALLKDFNVQPILPALKYANDGAIEDVLNTNGCAYYQWTINLIDIMKPTQVIELGGAMGVWTICALYNLPLTSKLYSITMSEYGLEFSYIKDKYTNFYPVIGNDLDLSLWPEDLNWNKTDILFIDSLHTEEHLRKELDLYLPLIRKDTLILLDDIRLPELLPVWEDIAKGKYGKSECIEKTDPLHYSGFGCCFIDRGKT